MKRMFMISALIAAMPCGVLLAQSTPPPASNGETSQAQMAGAPKIAPGSVIPVQLTKTVDAKKAKTGDEVVAKVTQDMKTQTGEVLVPKDTKVIGHVTQAQARTKGEKESELAIAFDRAVMNGQEVRLPMSIQAVIAPQNNNNNSAAGAAGGTDAGAGATSGGGVPSSSASGGRGGMGGSQAPPSASSSESTPSNSGNTQSGKAAYPPINAQTQGVIGVPNVTLSSAQNGAQHGGPVMSSEKSNVKLESGTMLLLKVNG